MMICLVTCGCTDGQAPVMSSPTPTGTVTVTGLENDRAYEIFIAATNEIGRAEAKAPFPVKPTDIKSKFAAAQSAKTAKTTKIQKLEGLAKRDLGPDLEFSQLDGKCVEKESGKFTYRVCGFDKGTTKT